MRARRLVGVDKHSNALLVRSACSSSLAEAETLWLMGQTRSLLSKVGGRELIAARSNIVGNAGRRQPAHPFPFPSFHTKMVLFLLFDR